MSVEIDFTQIIIALISTGGLIATAFITARYQTRSVRDSPSAKKQAVQRAVEKGELSGENKTETNKYVFKVSTKRLIFRSLLAALLAIFSIIIGMVMEENFDMTGEYMLIPLLIFSVMTAYFLFRLLYRFFWVAFIS
ncbi:MAG: hypothetical protein JJ858_06645 [Rhizobiaceae bacterium]|nr:hypothetical protein [Rhizobiaceae bacterium]